MIRFRKRLKDVPWCKYAIIELDSNRLAVAIKPDFPIIFTMKDLEINPDTKWDALRESLVENCGDLIRDGIEAAKQRLIEENAKKA